MNDTRKRTAHQAYAAYVMDMLVCKFPDIGQYLLQAVETNDLQKVLEEIRKKIGNIYDDLANLRYTVDDLQKAIRKIQDTEGENNTVLRR
ncbi:MAG: hypothetical protein KatS3mg083_315 [Candidatus Dojkabacteria bacterium]|nr:MAG: hypothetical protein KatS3mg083_315 [Candidatus Dojkabacteria bacterium]